MDLLDLTPIVYNCNSRNNNGNNENKSNNSVTTIASRACVACKKRKGKCIGNPCSYLNYLY